MSQSVYENIADESRYNFAPGGDTATIAFFVTNAASPYDAGLQIPYTVNDSYPGNDRLLVQSIDCRPATGQAGTVDTRQYRVTVYFAERPPENLQGTQWRYSSTLVDEESVLDAEGKIITVGYEYTTVSRDVTIIPTEAGAANYVDNTTTTTFTETKSVRVARQVPAVTWLASQFYPQATITSIKRFADAGGKLNEGEFLGYPAGSMLCQITDATQEADGYRVSYAFIASPSGTWRKTVYYTRDDGSIPTDVKAGEGYKEVDVYQRFNFNTLGLTDN